MRPVYPASETCDGEATKAVGAPATDLKTKLRNREELEWHGLSRQHELATQKDGKPKPIRSEPVRDLRYAQICELLQSHQVEVL